MVGSAIDLSWDHKVSTMGIGDSGITDTGGGLGGDNMTSMHGGRFLKTLNRLSLPANTLEANGGARALA